MAKVVKAESVSEYMGRESNDPSQSGVNPYVVDAEFESDNGTVGGRPAASLRISGSQGS